MRSFNIKVDFSGNNDLLNHVNELEPTHYKHIHSEAFRIMGYKCERCSNLELVWNSRDGAVPYFIDCPECKTLSSSPSNFYSHQYAPELHPPNEMRVFVDATKKLAKPKIKEMVDNNWENEDFRNHYKSKYIAVKKLLKSICGEGKPFIIKGKDFNKE